MTSGSQKELDPKQDVLETVEVLKDECTSEGRGNEEQAPAPPLLLSLFPSLFLSTCHNWPHHHLLRRAVCSLALSAMVKVEGVESVDGCRGASTWSGIHMGTVTMWWSLWW
jgi:hypothetical protein